MRTIAKAAHISEALLYRYFASKSLLFHSVVASALEESVALNDSYVDAARGDTSLHEFLLRVGHLSGDHMDSLHAWYVVRLLALPLNDEERRAVIDEPERAFQTVSDGMAARGVFDDSYVAARTFMGTLEYTDALGRIRSGAERPSARLREVFLEQLIELVAGGRSSGNPINAVDRLQLP